MSYSRLLSSSAALAIVTWSVASSAAAGAQPVKTAETSEERVAPARTLEDIIVTARRTSENLQNVPISVTAFSSNALAARNIDDTSSLTRGTPSLLVVPAAVGNPTVANTAIRGQVQSDSLITLDPSVGYYLDDIYLARAYGTALSLFDAERVEVLKGPQGTLYGRNTTGGAIKIITTKADSTAGVTGYVVGGYGNFDNRELGGAINLPLVQDVLAVRIVGRTRDRDGYTRADIFSPAGVPLGSRKQDASHTDLARVNVTFTPNDVFSLLVGYEHDRMKGIGRLIHNKLGDVPTATGFAESSPEFYRGAVNGASDAQANVDSVNATAQYELSDQFTAKLILGYRDIDTSYTLDIDGSAVPFALTTRNTQGATQYSGEFQVNGSVLDDRLKLIAGLYYFREKGFDRTATDGLFFPLGENVIEGYATNKSRSVFGSATYSITDSLNFTAGARYTKDTKPVLKRNTAGGTCILGADTPNFDPVACTSYASGSFSFLSWNAGLDWQVASDTMFYVKSARGYRSGGQNVRGLDAASSQPFNEERATDVEAGIKTELFDRRLRFNAAYFHTFYDDVQVSVIIVTPFGLATSVVNRAKGNVDGVEAELSAQLTDALTINASGSLTDFKYVGSDALQGYVPKWKAALSADYVIPVSYGKWTLSGSYNYRSRYFANNSTEASAAAFPQSITPGLGLFDARVGVDIDPWGLNIALYGRNLANKKYTDSPVVIGNIIAAAQFGEPRTYGFQVTKRF